MKDIHEVLRRKQARYAQLAKQIEMLQQAAEKLREVAPLLAEIEDDDAAVLADVDEQPSTDGEGCGSFFVRYYCPCQAGTRRGSSLALTHGDLIRHT
jgi:hypothetical protein